MGGVSRQRSTSQGPGAGEGTGGIPVAGVKVVEKTRGWDSGGVRVEEPGPRSLAKVLVSSLKQGSLADSRQGVTGSGSGTTRTP